MEELTLNELLIAAKLRAKCTRECVVTARADHSGADIWHSPYLSGHLRDATRVSDWIVKEVGESRVVEHIRHFFENTHNEGDLWWNRPKLVK